MKNLPAVDILIAGRGIAGLSAATHAGYEGFSVLCLGPDAGQLEGSAGIENFAGLPRTRGSVLLGAMRAEAEGMGADIRTGSVLSYVGPHHVVETSIGFVLAQAVILAVGSKQVPPECEVTDRLAKVDGSGVLAGTPFGLPHDTRHVVVVGGGNGGGQAAAWLYDRGAEVTLLCPRPPEETMSARLLRQLARDKAITLVVDRYGCAEEEAGRVRAINTKSGKKIQCDGVVFFAGSKTYVPEGFPRDRDGFVPTFGLETEVPFIYAIGDCKQGTFHRAASAAGEGAQVIAHIAGRIHPANQERYFQ